MKQRNTTKTKIRVDLRVEKVLTVSEEQKTFNPKMRPELFDSLSRTYFFDGEFGKRADRKLSQNSGKRPRHINLKSVLNTILGASTMVRKLYFSSPNTLETKEILFLKSVTFYPKFRFWKCLVANDA